MKFCYLFEVVSLLKYSVKIFELHKLNLDIVPCKEGGKGWIYLSTE